MLRPKPKLYDEGVAHSLCMPLSVSTSTALTHVQHRNNLTATGPCWMAAPNVTRFMAHEIECFRSSFRFNLLTTSRLLFFNLLDYLISKVNRAKLLLSDRSEFPRSQRIHRQNIHFKYQVTPHQTP